MTAALRHLSKVSLQGKAQLLQERSGKGGNLKLNSSGKAKSEKNRKSSASSDSSPSLFGARNPNELMKRILTQTAMGVLRSRKFGKVDPEEYVRMVSWSWLFVL